MDKKQLFHTSTTSCIPIKAMLNERLYHSLKNDKQIIPVHLQLSITNACNLSCAFCSFRDRDKTHELSLDSIMSIIDMFVKLGLQALTITGGGEPLCHPEINDILSFCMRRSVKVGLVTNGLLLEKLNRSSFEALTWCRISFADDRTDDDVDQIASILSRICPEAPSVDWSFSYVVLENQNAGIQNRIVSLAKSLGMLNVRFTPDQNHIEKVDMDFTIKNNGNDDICVYDKKTAGNSLHECWLYLLKPFIAADGYLYPCCCSQYCSDKNDFMMSDRICSYTDFEKKLHEMQALHPTCNKCYLSHYNEFIKAAINTVRHEEWI